MPSARVALLLLLTVVCAPRGVRADTLSGEPPSVAEPESNLDWAAVPLVAYDADTGFAFGAAGTFQWLGEVQPYRSQLTAQVLFTPGGLQSHWISLDAPRVLGSPLRLWARGEFIVERHSPYYGIGNSASDAVGRWDRSTGFERTAPLLRSGLSWPMGQRFFGFAFLTAQQVWVRAPPGSRLERDRPIGAAGGFAPNLTLGVFRDGRDREINSTRGTYLELSARGQGPGANYPYAGLNASGRVFLPIGERLVLGSRLIFDWESAGAPFWELGRFGGLEVFDGLGGAYSQRGITTKLYIGRLKAVGNFELRSHLFDVHAPGGMVSVGVVGFADVGRVWQLAGNDGRLADIHSGWGLGLRLWRRAFVLRGDIAFSRERGFAPYVLFGNLF